MSSLMIKRLSLAGFLGLCMGLLAGHMASRDWTHTLPYVLIGLSLGGSIPLLVSEPEVTR